MGEAQIGERDAGCVGPGREVGRVVGQRHDADTGARVGDHRRRARRDLVVAGAGVGDPGLVEVADRVEQRDRPVVEGVVVGERDDVDPEVAQHLDRDGRGAEEERLVRIGPPLAPVGDRALQVEQEHVGFPCDLHHGAVDDLGRRDPREPLAHHPSEHRVTRDAELHRRSSCLRRRCSTAAGRPPLPTDQPAGRHPRLVPVAPSRLGPVAGPACVGGSTASLLAGGMRRVRPPRGSPRRSRRASHLHLPHLLEGPPPSRSNRDAPARVEGHPAPARWRSSLARRRADWSGIGVRAASVDDPSTTATAVVTSVRHAACTSRGRAPVLVHTQAPTSSPPSRTAATSPRDGSSGASPATSRPRCVTPAVGTSATAPRWRVRPHRRGWSSPVASTSSRSGRRWRPATAAARRTPRPCHRGGRDRPLPGRTPRSSPRPWGGRRAPRAAPAVLAPPDAPAAPRGTRRSPATGRRSGPRRVGQRRAE